MPVALLSEVPRGQEVKIYIKSSLREVLVRVCVTHSGQGANVVDLTPDGIRVMKPSYYLEDTNVTIMEASGESLF